MLTKTLSDSAGGTIVHLTSSASASSDLLEAWDRLPGFSALGATLPVQLDRDGYLPLRTGENHGRLRCWRWYFLILS